MVIAFVHGWKIDDVNVKKKKKKSNATGCTNLHVNVSMRVTSISILTLCVTILNGFRQSTN